MYTYGQGILSSIRKGLSITSELKPTAQIETAALKEPAVSTSKTSQGITRKRRYNGGAMTPNLVSPSTAEEYDETQNPKAAKRQRQCNRVEQAQSPLFSELPQDVLHHVLSFLTDLEDRHSLQITCSSFRTMSNNANMIRYLELGGDPETGARCILDNTETPEQAIEGLFEFARAGNLRALYMTGMIVTYCYGDKIGVSLLKRTANRGCLRSAYALGLILRDSAKEESEYYLGRAIDSKFLPACQELFTSQQVKEMFGVGDNRDLDALTLKRYFDSVGLNRLLGRCYLQSSGVRRVQSSHCWNPMCGRWAFKATPYPHPNVQQRGNRSLPPLAPHLEASLSSLLPRSQQNCQNFMLNSHADSFTDTDTCGINTTTSKPNFTFTSGSEKLDFSAASTCYPTCDDPISKSNHKPFRVSRMKMCSQCRRAKYCSKLCQVYDWRSGRHKVECRFL